MEARGFRWLSLAVAAMLIAALLGGMFLPVYTDEVGWRFQERAGFDGIDKVFSVICGPNTLAVPPWFMMPARWYSALFNGAFPDPFWIRFSGVLYALTWVALAVTLIRRVTDGGENRAIVSTIGLGLLALGTTPLVMVWSRPEQPIGLAAAVAIVIAFTDGAGKPLPPSSTRQAWQRSLAIWALSCVAVSYHVKGLFLLPVMLGCLAFASRGAKARLPRLITGLAMLGTTGSAVLYWHDRRACPVDPILSAASAHNNLSGVLAQVSSLAEARDLFGKMLENVGFARYLTSVGPQTNPLSFWLERNQIGEDASFTWFLAICLAWALALIGAGAIAVLSLIGGLREGRIDPRPVLATLIAVVVLGWAALQVSSNVYESNFVLPLSALAVILGLSARDWGRLRPTLVAAAALVGIFALVSPVLIAATYAPSLARAAYQQGHLKAQPFSIGVFGYAKVRREVEAAARLCRIDDPSRMKAMMVDDVTYFPFIRSYAPDHAFGVVGGWKGTISDPIAYLKGRGSDGMIVSCRFLPGDLRARAKRVGNFCCMAAPDW
jgi:hypothetical protein